MLVPDVLITHATIISMDRARRVFWDGALAIHNGQILDVGESKTLRSKYPQVKELIDASNKLLLPGYINAHTHIAMALFRGLYTSEPRSIYSIMFPIEGSLEPEDVYYLAMLGAVECLRGGATCIADHYYFMDEVAQAINAVGLRAVLGHTIADRLAPFAGEREKQRAFRFIDDWREMNPRITPVLAPHSPETVSAETLRELKRMSDDEDILLHIHLAQSPQEVEYISQMYATSPVEFLDSIGFLGGNLLAAHSVFLSDSDIERLRSNQVSVVFCPTSQVSYLYSDVTPVPELLASGVRVALGTDSAAGPGNMSILEEPRIASTVQLLRARENGKLSPQRILEMVTVDAAAALKLDARIGSLEPGKRADLILIDLQNAELAPINDIYATTVYGIIAPHIDTIMIDGEVVLSNGIVVGVDEKQLVEKAAETRTAVLTRALERHPGLSRSLNWSTK